VNLGPGEGKRKELAKVSDVDKELKGGRETRELAVTVRTGRRNSRSSEFDTERPRSSGRVVVGRVVSLELTAE